jgi:VanZ like family
VLQRLRELWISPRTRQVLSIVLPAATVGVIFYFALMPNVRRDVLNILPARIRSWCGTNDDLSNLLLFAILGFITFQLRIRSERVNESSRGRFAGLILLVVGLEVAQMWIPGRFSSVRDVITGSAGVFIGWLLSWIRDLKR